MKIYAGPCFETLKASDFLLVSIQQYQIDLLSQCPTAQGFVTDISLQNNHEGTLQACAGEDPPTGFLFTIQCQETGGTTYTWTLGSFTIGEACSDGNLYTVNFNIDPSMPGSCTITSFVIAENELCNQS